MRIVLLLLLIPLAACQKQKCDELRAAWAEPAPTRPMTVRDLPTRDRKAIEVSCSHFDINGDIAGRRKCIQDRSEAAVAGQRVVDSSQLKPIPGQECDAPWNR